MPEDACDGFSASAGDLIARPGPDGGFMLETQGFAVRCAIGRGGFILDKREGDGGSPIGRWPLREVFFRPDQMDQPASRLPIRPIARDDGWCDAPDDPNYNRPVKLPYAASHEEMWRSDRVYDVVIVVGYNDDPVLPGRGSAIFMHLSRDNYAPTAGCIAVSRDDMFRLLPLIGPDTHLVIQDC
jgi:L,D-peptidoglycan transpeptidase YkuD (ErfK/YbiS/YcfS/YnhG family)